MITSLLSFIQILILPVSLSTVTIFMAVLSALLILISFLYLQFDIKRIGKKRNMLTDYGDLISEIILCSNEEELLNIVQESAAVSLLKKHASKPMLRSQLTEELVKLHRNLSGTAADNIKWLYTRLNLHQHSLQLFQSSQWHIKTNAIQQLAQMGQRQYLTKIYRATNDTNLHIRMEAQLALVKFGGFEGLRFLSVSRFPLSAWQQLGLLKELSMHTNIEAKKINSWLGSKNETVVEFALKLIHQYHCYDLHDEVADCLKHASALINRQAILTLKEIHQPRTANVMMNYFFNCNDDMQVPLLETLKEIDATEKFYFFNTLLTHKNEIIRNIAASIVQQGPVLHQEPLEKTDAQVVGIANREKKEAV